MENTPTLRDAPGTGPIWVMTKCPQCGLGNTVDMSGQRAATCGRCGTDMSQTLAPEFERSPSPPPVPKVTVEVEKFKNLEIPTRIMKSLLGIMVAFNLLSLMTGFDFRSLAMRVAGGGGFRLSRLAETEAWIEFLSLAQIGALVLTIIVFVWWTYRAYANLDSFGSLRRFGKPWAIFGWFIPIMSFFRPKQLVNEIWRESRPGPLRERAERSTVHPVINLWWIGWLTGGGVGRLGMSYTTNAVTPDQVVSLTAWWIATDLIVAATGVLAIVMVDLIAKRQHERRDYLKEVVTSGESLGYHADVETDTSMPLKKLALTALLGTTIAVVMWPGDFSTYNLGRAIGAAGATLALGYLVAYAVEKRRPSSKAFWLSPVAFGVAALLAFIPFFSEAGGESTPVTAGGSLESFTFEGLDQPDKADLEDAFPRLRGMRLADGPEEELRDLMAGTPFQDSAMVAKDVTSRRKYVGAIFAYSAPPGILGPEFLEGAKLGMEEEGGQDLETSWVPGAEVVQGTLGAGYAVTFTLEEGIVFQIFALNKEIARDIASQLSIANL